MKNKNNKIKFFAFIIVSMISVNCLIVFPSVMAFPGKENLYTDITVEEAAIMMKKTNKYPNLIILDVRTKEEFETSHFFGAINIPLDEIEEGIEEIGARSDNEIIVYCKAGSRSESASEILGNKGFSKVYNIVDGILAWVNKDFPIWTTRHHITVNKVDHDSRIIIEPYIKFLHDYITCESGGCLYNDSENNSTSEITVITTNIWTFEEKTNDLNKSTEFIQKEFIIANVSYLLYVVEYLVVHEQYNLSIVTFLEPLDSGIYNSSYTYIDYIPVNGIGLNLTTMEFVDFESPIKLSQIYSFLSQIACRMIKIYDDMDLPGFVEGYRIIAMETTKLSNLIKKNIQEYNRIVITSTATLRDNFWTCMGCLIICEAIILFGLATACILYPPFCPIAFVIIELNLISAGYTCDAICTKLEHCP